MMQIQWKDGVRVHADCGGEAVIVPGEGYICTTCGEQSFSGPSEEEQERERDEYERKELERERDEYESREREQGYE